MEAAATRALAWREFVDSRVRNLSFALFFALYAYANGTAYVSTYPTLADRMQFAQSFGDNKALRIFYGVPKDLLTAGGYAEWRVGGILQVIAAILGLVAAVKVMRAQEDSGRYELLLSGPFGRARAFWAALVAVLAGTAVISIATFAGLAAANLNVGDSALLALATASVAVSFAAVGALVSQLASSRRMALELGTAAFAVAFLLRVVSDTQSNLAWLRWATPLGWAEDVHPFTDFDFKGFLPAVAAAVALLWLSLRLWLRRDVGGGLLRSRESRPPRLGLLSSPTALALRGEAFSLGAWIAGTAVFAFVVGVLSASVSGVNISKNLEQQFQKLGAISITTASGYLALTFLFFVLVVSLFCCSQMTAARHEESDERLETLFSSAVGRQSWFVGRLALAVGGAVAISLAAGVLAWAGAASQGADVSFTGMLKAGVNCLPASLLFLSLAALAFAVVPRATTGFAYGIVLLAFVWELFGSLLNVPTWTLDLSPFHQLGLVPAEGFKTVPALVMLAIASVAAIAATLAFRRRDLTGA
jgi:polyether ionophore transport system permease protein